MICWKKIFNLTGKTDLKTFRLTCPEFSSFKNLLIKTRIGI
jgi:hypothetical protein